MPLAAVKSPRRLQRVVAGRLEVDVVGLAADKHLALGAAAVDLDRLLIGVEHVEGELVALGDQLPVLLAAAGIDDVAALRALGPLAVAVRERGTCERQAEAVQAWLRSARNMSFSLVG